MTKKFLALALLLVPALAPAQSYEPDGAIRSMSQTHVWNSGTSAWDKWEGVVTGPLTDVQLRATPVPISGTITANQGGAWTVTANAGSGTFTIAGTVTANQGGTWTVQQGTPPWSVSQSGAWTVQQGTPPWSVSASGTFPVTGTFWPTTAGAPGSFRLSDGAAFYDAAKTGQLPAALDGSGFFKVHEQGTAAVSAASLPLPTGAATEATLATRAADATITNRLPAGSTPADNESNAVTATRLGAYNFVFDGSAWDRWTGGVSQIGTWTVTGAGGTFPVTGTFWPTTAGAPASHRLSDGTAFYDATKTGQLPAALVGSRLDVNLGAIGGTGQNGAQLVDVGNTAWRVNCITGCTAGGSFADGAAFTFGTTPVSNTAFVVDDTASTTVAENSAGAGRMSTNRIPYFALRTAAGAALLGQGTMANSIPVAIASDQSTLSNKIVDGTGAGQADVTAVAPALTNEGLNVRLVNSARTAAGTLDGTSTGSSISISGEGASSITFSIGNGLTGSTGRVFAEASQDGVAWSGTAIVPAGLTSSPSAFAPIDYKVPFNETSNTIWSLLYTGFAQYRVRTGTAGTGSATVTIHASSASRPGSSAPPYYQTTSTGLDLSIFSLSVSIFTYGSGTVIFRPSATFGSAVVTPEASIDNVNFIGVPVYPINSASTQVRTTLTGDLTADSFAFRNSGYTIFRLRVTTTGSGSPTFAFGLSTTDFLPRDERPGSQYTAGASPTSEATHTPRLLATPEGIQAVTLDHPRWFQCAMTSTATTSTVITTCSGAVTTLAAPGAGLRHYITSFAYSSSIISTTANFMTLRYGTGGTCGTGTTSLWVGSNAAAFSPREPALGPNGLKAGLNSEVCFIHPGAGTRWIDVAGYIAP